MTTLFRIDLWKLYSFGVLLQELFRCFYFASRVAKLLSQRLCVFYGVGVGIVIEISVDAAGLFALLIADILTL
jgi:hypothetical protein